MIAITKIKTKLNNQHTSFYIVDEFFNGVKSFTKEKLLRVPVENN